MSTIFLIYSHFLFFSLKNTICKRNRKNSKNRGNRGQAKIETMNEKSKTGLTDKFRPPKTKVCRLCMHEKPTKDFARNVRGRSGYANECRACNREQENKKTEQQKEQAKIFFDAKFFTIFLLFSASLTAFSQSIPLDDMAPNTTQYILGKNGDGDTLRYHIRLEDRVKPDTLRALILASMCRKCAAEPMPGYVVIERYKRPVYLDCRKRALRWPQVGWDFREVDLNYKK